MIEGVSIEMSLESAMSKSLGNRHFCFISNTLQAAACMHGCLGLMNACRRQQCSWGCSGRQHQSTPSQPSICVASFAVGSPSRIDFTTKNIRAVPTVLLGGVPLPCKDTNLPPFHLYLHA